MRPARSPHSWSIPSSKRSRLVLLGTTAQPALSALGLDSSARIPAALARIAHPHLDASHAGEPRDPEHRRVRIGDRLDVLAVIETTHDADAAALYTNVRWGDDLHTAPERERVDLRHA